MSITESQARIAQAIVNLDAWLQTMRQSGGYGGPVAHWWQNRFQYTGPGLDWRYEGILVGYATLYEKTGDAKWSARLNLAAEDLLRGQCADGSYQASRFEINPGALGTPHEAAATLGLLTSLPHLSDTERVMEAAKRNLDNLIAKLWDGRGFNDRPGGSERVPNKLATLAQALIAFAQASGEEEYLDYAQSCLEDVLRFRVNEAANLGAVHQYAPGIRKGDGRFFPYYNARCVPPLIVGAELFGEPRYREAARQILAFIGKSMNTDGSWPQVIYASGARAEWPRWVAGVADILTAYRSLGEALPETAFERLLTGQLTSGAFSTAAGFASQIDQRVAGCLRDYRDVSSVVGWNDKAFHLLSRLFDPSEPLPHPEVGTTEVAIEMWGLSAVYVETDTSVTIRAREGILLYDWHKHEPWARVAMRGTTVR